MRLEASAWENVGVRVRVGKGVGAWERFWVRGWGKVWPVCGRGLSEPVGVWVGCGGACGVEAAGAGVVGGSF